MGGGGLDFLPKYSFDVGADVAWEVPRGVMFFFGGTFVLFPEFLSLVPTLGFFLPGLFPNGGVVARADGDGGLF